MKNVYSYYENNIDAYSRRAESLKKRIHLYGTIRLLLVVAALASVWFLKAQDWKILAGAILLYCIPFAVLMWYHAYLSRKKEYAEALISLCRNEIKGLDYDFAAFDGAAEKADANHSFSLDLDLFGEKSFFQSVNRTVTHLGKELLAGWLQDPLTDKAQILKRQEAVKELSSMSQLRQQFYVNGVLYPGGKNDMVLLSKLTNTSVCFAGSWFWRAAIWVVPVVWTGLFVGLGLELVSPVVFGSLFTLSLLIAYAKIKHINELHNTVNKMEKLFAMYASLMKSIEGDTYKSTLLNEISSRLICNKVSASQAIKKLSAHIGTLDQRSTLTGVLFNIFTFSDIRTCISLEKWKLTYGKEASVWFESLAHFDALGSLAGFAFNHPDYIYPSIADSYFKMSGKELGHPLIHRDACVKNDISIEKSPWFLIITGANMAGKSTYLRTVGINYLLSCIGAPACAAELTVYPAKIVTSLRTSDSLVSNESYFFAELKRLKMIIDRLKDGEELFIILDEILKGTNSIDKQKGSFALMRQLVACQSCGIIATHDLALGSLEEEFSSQIKNYRFEADITNEELTFTYKLREGVAQNMNATFLMKKMGITM